MPKRTVDQWRKLFDTHHQSGLSAAAFCREQNLCPKYFSLRKNQLGWREESGIEAPAPAQFIKAVVSSQPTTLELYWHEARLTLPGTVEPQWLGTLLKALT